VVLSNGLWKRRFAADPGVVDSTVSLNGSTYTVVGVMPADFNLPKDVDIWVPLALNKAQPANRGSHYLDVVARIKSGVSYEQARNEMEALAGTLSEKYPNNYPADGGLNFFLMPLHEEVVGNIKPVLILLLVAVALVLMIACFNVANMLLARATSREKEIAVRSALGAGRGRLVRQLLTESVMLAIIGGAIGVALAFLGVQLFVMFGPSDIPRLSEIGVDPRVLGVSLIVTVLTGLLFGLAPALHTSKPDLNDALKEGGRGSTGKRHILRNVLVVGEVAFALMLLITAGLTMKSFQQLLALDLGFRTEGLMTTRVTLPQSKYQENPQVVAFYRQAIDRVKSLPGVESVGAITQLPLSGAYSSGTTVIEDTSAGEGLQRFQGYPYLEADRRSVAPGYFTSLGVRLIEGRLLDDRDREDSPAVAVVDEKFAKRFWPSGSAVGKRVAVGGNPQTGIQWGEIVGVIGHIHHYGTNREGQEQAYFPEGREQIYFPFTQRPARTMFLTVRTAVDPLSITGAVRGEIQSLDPELPIYEERTMGQLISRSVAQPRLNLVLMGIFAVIALILASVGIYGVMSYSVTQRTHEIGIRMALGAQRLDVLKMVIGQGLVLTGIGTVLGLAGAFAGTRLLSTLLFGVSATDPVIFIIISLVLAGVALLACFIPARRATKVDPMIALRYE
jgi:putative ABC transport system permease protein